MHPDAALPVAPQARGVEADRICRFITPGGAVRFDIGQRIRAIQPYHDAFLAADVARAPGVAGSMPLAHPDPVTDTEPALTWAGTWIGDRRREHRTAERERAARARLEVLAGEQPVLDGQGGGRGEPVLVVARHQVVPRRHPLDGVPELTAAGLHRAKHDLHECPGPRLPRLVKGGFRRGMVNRAEALHAAQVMDAVHAEDSTERRNSGTGGNLPSQAGVEVKRRRASSAGTRPR